MKIKPSIQWLFVFIPVTLVLEKVVHASAPVVFFSAALAIVPIAALIIQATEQLAARTGDAVGGLLNATFGNAPELIISLVALKAGNTELVRASIVGAILANLLLALGVSFFLGGLNHHTQEYNPGALRVYSTMMLLAVVSVAVPSAFGRLFSDSALREEQLLNTGLAIVLLAAYGLYLFFMLGTHPDAFQSTSSETEEHGPGWSLPLAIGGLVGASLLAAWMSEILVGAAEGT
ncbi:MAG TPA: cation transporter, partial [Thermoanaerobaculia bacterium]|nr:cation transporter [Thermoanaerobaculia bacterium]